jgi:hypothetical protein
MLISAEIALALQLLEKLRELTAPAESPTVRDGSGLARFLGVSRSKAWQIAKDPAFNVACPAKKLRPRHFTRQTLHIRAWLESDKENPGPAGPGAPTARGRQTALTHTITDRADGSPPRRRRASRTR